MKVANACNAEDVSVRLCFLVKVRNASGRKVAGGSRIGKTAAFGCNAGGARMAATRRGLMGCAGVPKAGEDEGIGFAGTAEGFSGRFAVAISSVCRCHTNWMSAYVWGANALYASRSAVAKSRWSKLGQLFALHQTPPATPQH